MKGYQVRYRRENALHRRQRELEFWYKQELTDAVRRKIRIAKQDIKNLKLKLGTFQ